MTAALFLLFTKGAGNITCISEECANQQVHTKQCEGEIKVSLTLTGKKETISQLKDLPVYMYIDYSKEIIDRKEFLFHFLSLSYYINSYKN